MGLVDDCPRESLSRYPPPPPPAGRRGSCVVRMSIDFRRRRTRHFVAPMWVISRIRAPDLRPIACGLRCYILVHNTIVLCSAAHVRAAIPLRPSGRPVTPRCARPRPLRVRRTRRTGWSEIRVTS